MRFRQILCIAMEALFTYVVFAVINNKKNSKTVSIPGTTVLLHCPMNLSAIIKSWSREYQILSQGNDIDFNLPQRKRLKINYDEERSYSLEITNITKSDGGIYCCDYEMDTAYQKCTYLDVIDEPFCLPENIFDGINENMDQMTLKANVYNINVSDLHWLIGEKYILNSFKYLDHSIVSYIEKEIFGNIINVTVTTVFLRILNLTSEDFNRNYTVTVKYDNRTLICTYELPAEERPDTPRNLKVKLYGPGITISWVSKARKAVHYHVTFYIKYTSSENDTWKTLMHKRHSQNSMNIFNLMENTDYYLVMYAENIFGKSNETDIMAIRTGNRKPEIKRSEMTLERLMLIVVSVLLLIIISTLFCNFIRRKMITVSVIEVADAQSITAGGSHYDEIDIESDRNISVSTAANAAVVHSDIHLNRGTSEASREISVEAQEMVDDNRMPFTVEIGNEIPVQALQRLEFAENVTKETIAQMIRETQVLVIRETVEQVLKEKASSKHRNTSFTTSSEGDDTSIQTSGSGYLNPYQPLHIDSNLIEHPYTETTI